MLFGPVPGADQPTIERSLEERPVFGPESNFTALVIRQFHERIARPGRAVIWNWSSSVDESAVRAGIVANGDE
jgi:hypothetical protein